MTDYPDDFGAPGSSTRDLYIDMALTKMVGILEQMTQHFNWLETRIEVLEEYVAEMRRKERE